MEWESRAEQAQQALDKLFWNPKLNMYDIEIPCPDGTCNTIFHYWWMAHGVDVLTDGYKRTGEKHYVERLSALFEGILLRNGGAFPNELYDDMEWMAIAWLRAYEATGEDKFKQTALELWEDIQTGWNSHMGGGIAWQKTQLDYKNTPANAPAIILAARLYRAFGKEEDLAWAVKIYNWLNNHLVDPATGFVWDGVNRTGDGMIDTDWKFTYCQGVYIGAAIELYRITKHEAYLHEAYRTMEALASELAHPVTGLLPDEGDGDGGLFKGILVRYLGQLASESPSYTLAVQLLKHNAVSLWEHARDRRRIVFGTSWSLPPQQRVTLSAQLSAVMLLEQMAALERQELLAYSELL